MGKMIPNSTPVPNIYFDQILYLLTASEQSVLLYLCRRTFGFHRAKECISLKQFCDGKFTKDGRQLDHGTALSRNTVKKAIKSLIAFHLIEITAKPVEYPIKSRKSTEYAIQLDESKIPWPDLWDRNDFRKEKASRSAAHLSSHEVADENFYEEEADVYFEDNDF